MLPSETYSCAPASLGSHTEQLKLISCASVACEDNHPVLDGFNFTGALKL